MCCLMTGILDHIFKTYLTSFNPIRTSGVEFDPFKDIPVFPPLHGFIFAFMKLQCRKGCTAVIANYFNTDQVLEMVLADGSDLEDVRKSDVFLEGSVRPLPPCDRSSLLAEEVFCLISQTKSKIHCSNIKQT